MDIQSNDLIQELRKESFLIKSTHTHEIDKQLDVQFNELKEEIQKVQNKNFEIISKLKLKKAGSKTGQRYKGI